MSRNPFAPSGPYTGQVSVDNLPIRDYAMVGDCHGSALISQDGSVDWCCLARFDAEPVFCRLLDVNRGGFLSIRPTIPFEVQRDYEPRTNVLRTVFTTREGELAVTDVMPTGRAHGAGIHDYVSLKAPHWLVRQVECRSGSVPVHVRCRPTVDWARRPTVLQRAADGLRVEGGPWLYSDFDLHVQGDMALAELRLQAGERRFVVIAAERAAQRPSAETVEHLLAVTRAFWEEWSDYCRYDGPCHDAVLRSALVLKMLTWAPSGAVVAAPTTSLPEQIGGERNWDYRFCWPRDATFMLYALAALGYSGEARRFSDFLTSSFRQSSPGLEILYGINGETELDEQVLEHLRGYAGSRPVRIGNAAHAQQQLDIYGQVLDWAYLNQTMGARLNQPQRQMLQSFAGFIADHWHEPGQGLWEMRGPARHHVYGKMMCWVALDRAVRLFGPEPRLERIREEIRQSVLQQGIDPATGGLRQAYGEPGTDAALLLAPLIGFPLKQETLEATVAGVERELQRGDYLARYVTEDGLSGGEGAFMICSFWMVNAKLLTGRVDEARQLFERLLQCGNDVGLYSEEIDPGSGAFLGNFPQAFTHLALIECAVNLQLCEEYGPDALQGTHADRALYSVEATSGPRALWAAFRKTGRIGRLWSSRQSKIPRQFD